jgi:hypothetical protein
VSNGAIGSHLLDAGPMLCLGGSSVMADLYDAHFAADGAIVAVVEDEVRGWASAYVAPGDPRRIGGVKRAGTAAVARYASTLFTAAIPTPDPEPTAVLALRQDLEEHANRKRPGRESRPNEHAGEAYSIHEAAQRGVLFVSNDDGARQVAHMRSVAHESFVDVMRRLVKLQQEVNRKQILKEMQRLVLNGVDVGDVVNSVLDLQ